MTAADGGQPRGPRRSRGLWLAALAALVILIGGGAALWSLFREIRAGSIRLEAPPSPQPSPPASRAAG